MGRKNEERIYEMRILQDRYSHGNMQTSGISYDNQRKRIHILLPEMRPAISTKKEVIKRALISQSIQPSNRISPTRLQATFKMLQQKLHAAVLNKSLILSARGNVRRKSNGCWKWFDGVLKEAGIEVTNRNKDKIDDIIHHYIGEQSSHGHCSAVWKKARKEIAESAEMKRELIEKLKRAR
jgi:hypothetical protein